MENIRFIFTDPENVSTFKDRVLEDEWQWVYCGVDSNVREAVKSILGSENRFFFAQDLQRLCLLKKEEFLNWVTCWEKDQDMIIGIGSLIAYKSPLGSDLFLNYCYMLLTQEWIKEDRKMLIVLENPWLLKACSENFHRSDIQIFLRHTYFLKKCFKGSLMANLRLLSKAWYSMVLLSSVKVHYLMSKLRPLVELEDAADVFTCTWIEERSFKGGQFQDPYLGNLNAFYEKEGLRTKTLSLPLFPRVLLTSVLQNANIIPMIYFSSFSDIFYSFYRTLTVNPTRKVNSINGLDLTCLLDDASTAGKDVVFQSTLNYHCFLRFFKQPGLSFSALVYPFENQPWDKVMIKAMRDSGRVFKGVGYQHSTISPLLLNYFLGKGEDKVISLPDAIVANGKHWASVLKNARYSCPIENGGSLRFTPRAKTVDLKNDPHNIRHENEDNVLVLLSASLWYSLDLLYFVLSSAQTNRTYLIKPHPDISERIIRKNIPHFPDNFIFIEGSMDECMAKAGWAVHIGTTAAFECMMKGLTVFKYLPERIDLDPLLGLDIEQRIVTDHDELDFSYKAQSDEVDNSLIAEPFNEDAWKEILK
jgi:hypothetical protein